jgi:hypothetical protein
MKAVVIAMLLSAWAVGSQQQSATSLTDVSQTGSPVVLSGTVTATDEVVSGSLRFSFRTNISAANVSRKSILLVVVKMNLTGANGLGIKHTRSNDYFFTSDIFYADMVEAIQETVGPVGELLDKTETQTRGPTAIAKVVFVQFLDGSTWGDPVESRDALQQRHDTLIHLELLRSTYQSKGEKEFLDELMQPSRLPGIGALQQLHKDNVNDPGIVIGKFTKMLNYAEIHQRGMESKNGSE